MQHLSYYIALLRLNKPIGIFLLLWPTLWAIWLANTGHPQLNILIIFTLGVILMRSAGCVINDFADRQIDQFVERTKDRPLTSGKVSIKEALIIFFILLSLSFILVLFCNALTIGLAFIGAMLAVIYPFLKRITYLPQLGLSVAFSWGVPMAFAASNQGIPNSAWVVFLAATCWPIAYDTLYAMVDKKDDVKINVKSTAILFGNQTNLIVGLLQSAMIVFLILTGILFHLSLFYYLSLAIAALFFLYQQWLIHAGDSSDYFNAFLNNHWVGLIIFLGIILSYL